MQIHFWGVRGSIAVSGPRFQRTGGNTSCLELRLGADRLVLDAGTGLRALGEHLGCVPVDLALAFSHVHWDHIVGFPFFAPLFHPDSRITILGAARESGSVMDALRAQMAPPRFPVPFDALPARIRFQPLLPGRPVDVGPFTLLAGDLSHPDGTLGLRVQAGGRTVVYATDHEHGGRHLDRRLLHLAQGADLLVHDAQYTPAEYQGGPGPSRRGWGHSTWVEAVAAADQAGVGRLALFHHDPGRDDDELAVIEAQARGRRPATLAAREGLALAL